MVVMARDSNIRVEKLEIAGVAVSNAYMLVCQQTADSLDIKGIGNIQAIIR